MRWHVDSKVTLWALCLAFLYAPLGWGQEPAAPPSASPGFAPASSPAAPEAPKVSAGPAAVEGSQLETFLLRDNKGNLVPVLDLPFEEFERLLRIKRGLAPPAPPAYSLDALSITGSVEQNVADLQITATIRVREPGLVRVPLALGQTILRGPTEYEGPGDHFLTHDETDGYVCWLRGSDAKPHIVKLHVSVAMDAGSEPRLALRLPRATESSLRVVVPVPKAEARLPRGDGIVSVRPQGNDRSEVTVLGPASDMELTWEQGRESATAKPAWLESNAEIVVKIEGENRISSDVRLRVRSFGGSVSSLRVRLPPGMELVPMTAAGYSVSIVESDGMPPGRRPPTGQAASGQAAQIVEIKFDRPIAGIADARLLAAQAAGVPSQSLMPARFEVLGAVRQRGTIDFAVEGDWQLTWKEDPSVRRLDVAADASSAKLAARYEFSRQPCALSLTVATRPSRISVEPVHVVYIDDQQVRLESTLKYRLRGARAEGLKFTLGDWKLDRLSPGDLFDIVTPTSSGDTTPLVPFRSGVAVPAELELKLEAHRPLEAKAEEVSFTLPRPLGDVVSPATVMIVAADNVELIPQISQISGMSLDSAAGIARIGTRQQPPLVYRDLGADEPARFAAALRVRTRWTTASARATVQLTQQQIEVEQRLDYRIAYERRRSFDILIPRPVLVFGTLQVASGEESLTPTPIADAPLTADASRFQIVTPSDQIGLCQIVIRYSLPLPKWDRQRPLPLQIPLVVPADEPHQQLGGQQLEFITPEPWRLDPDPEGSDEFSRPAPTTVGGQRVYAWSRVASQSQWILQALESPAAANIAISKAWTQTWLSSRAREERAVFRFTTDRDELRVRLPAAPIAGSVQAVVNARAVTTAAREPATVVIPVPAAARGRESVVELWYAVEIAAPTLGVWSPQLKPAALEGASPPRRVLWQLCLPGNQHLVHTPADLAPQARGNLFPWIGGRRASLAQEQLELWIGASRQDPLPQGANEYLLSMLGPPPTLDLTALDRRTALTFGAGASLAIGLLLMHVRMLRRPESLFALVVVLAALALVLPEASILAAQAAVVGLAVALGVAFCQWAIWGRATWTTAPAGSTVIPVESRSTEAPHPRLERLSGLTTATAPAGGHVVEPAP